MLNFRAKTERLFPRECGAFARQMFFPAYRKDCWTRIVCSFEKTGKKSANLQCHTEEAETQKKKKKNQFREHNEIFANTSKQVTAEFLWLWGLHTGNPNPSYRWFQKLWQKRVASTAPPQHFLRYPACGLECAWCFTKENNHKWRVSQGKPDKRK